MFCLYIMSGIKAFAEFRIGSVLKYSTDSEFKNNKESGHEVQTIKSLQSSDSY